MFEKIGDNAVAVVQGMPLRDGFGFPRQYNTFYYVSGIETPGAYLRLDGRTRRVTLYLPRATRGWSERRGGSSAEDGEQVKRLTPRADGTRGGARAGSP